jgi:NAD(P)-dependent dehydrogenase (short-subunit alcohol dehydrogenase family)
LGERSAVVTGGGRGIGLASVLKLAERGWHVVALDLREKDLSDLAARRLPNVRTLAGDVADQGSLRAAVDLATSMSPLAGWVNNAAVAPVEAVHLTTREQFDRAMAVNVGGTFWGCSVAINAFLASRIAGAVVNVSSIHGSRGFQGWGAYDTTKGAIEALTRNLAVEYGPYGIRANAVAPGTIRTPMHVEMLARGADPEAAEALLAAHPPLGRVGHQDEVGAVVAFLLSDEASYVSGQTIGVDGGWNAQAQLTVRPGR